jgi:ATP-dependent Clp protease ATP-binding subunit ClpC
MVKEGNGVAANVLKNLNVELRQIRLEVEKIVQRSPEFVTGEISLSSKAENVIKIAWEESRHLNHNYVGTEHLLLGMLQTQDGVAAQVLVNLGLHCDDVRRVIVNLLAKSIIQ